MKIEFSPIGIIHTPFKSIERMPIQPTAGASVRGTVEVFPEFAEALKDLDGFSHIILLYYFHKARGMKLTVVPFLDTTLRGLFSTRAPKRPNPIGLSVVMLRGIKGSTLEIQAVDILDNTPLLDIKPYVPEFEDFSAVRTGWLEKAKGSVKSARSDNRFR